MKTAPTLSGLQDIELPPESIATGFMMLASVIMISLVILLIWLYRKQQQPLRRAKRELLALSGDTLSADNIAHILRQGLQLKRLKNSVLPKDFILRLEHARFSSGVNDKASLVVLKKQALGLLEALEKKTGENNSVLGNVQEKQKA